MLPFPNAKVRANLSSKHSLVDGLSCIYESYEGMIMIQTRLKD